MTMPETTQSDLVERLTEMADLYRRAISDDNEDAQTFADAAAEIARLRKRLEIREPDWPEAADGIACRDDTIALLDDRVARQSDEIERLRRENQLMREALEAECTAFAGMEEKLIEIAGRISGPRGGEPCHPDPVMLSEWVAEINHATLDGLKKEKRS